MTNTLPTGFYPFWFWNDRLSADEIRWQVAEMARQGVRGFFIHSRQGLGQPYLSEAFFEMVDVAVAVAEEHGLAVHLYDEYPYPSGVAGGQVTMGQPQYHATELIQRVYTAEGGPVRLELPIGKVLSVVAYPLIAHPHPGETRPECFAIEGHTPGASTGSASAPDSKRVAPDWSRGIDLAARVGPLLVVDSYRETGLTRYNQKRYFASRPTPVLEATLPDAPHRIFVSVQAEVTHHKYWGHFGDVLNPEAVHQFIRLTHERYGQRYGDKFGRSIHSIFVDETQPGWSKRLPDAFRAEYGYDLCAHLPALQDETHPDHLRVTQDLYRLRYELFCRAWEEPISSWCRGHGLAYAGEKPSLRMAQLRYMDIPGCEPGHTKAGSAMDLMQPHLRQNAKATASAAYFYGKIGALDECYHSLGWSGTLQDAKLMADGQLLAGIKFLVPHGFFYSTHALRKHDAPPTFFFQAPYWPLFGKLSAHVDRIGQLFEGTHIDAEILVVEPSSGLPSRADLGDYARVQALLMENHLGFHFADTDILQDGRVEAGVLHVADLAVRLVIVPPMRAVEPPLAAWLAAFEAAGGKVIRCPNDFAPAELLSAIRAVVSSSLSVQAAGAETPAVQVVKRMGGGRTLWFVLNTGAETLHVVLAAGVSLREIPLETGRSPSLARAPEPAFTGASVLSGTERRPRSEVEGYPSSGHCYTRAIAPFESFMLEACDEHSETASFDCGQHATQAPAQDAGSSTRAKLLPSITIPLRGPARVRPLNPNLLRLAEWRMSILDASGVVTQTASVPAVPLSDQLEQGGFRFAPSVRRYFGHEPELDWPPLRVRYDASFEIGGSNPPPEAERPPQGSDLAPAGASQLQTGIPNPWAVELVIEPGSIAGDWQLWVNDGGPLVADDFAPTAAHVRGSLGADITAMLRPGTNTLRVDITEARPEGGLLNPLYLAGDFGVGLSPLRLEERLEVGGFETHEANGLPFYAGVIEYAMGFDLPELPAGERVRADVVTDAPFQEACEVSINGGAWRCLAWEPRSLELSTAELIPGRNEVRVKVYTTLIRAFEGQWFDHTGHCYRDIKSGPTGVQPAVVTATPAPGASEHPPEPQLQMVWPEHLLGAPPAVRLPPGYALRTYRPGDEMRFYEVMALAGWPGWDDAKLQPWLARIPPESWYMVIHEASGQIVATAMGLHDHSTDHPFGGELGWVAADPAHTGKGLGRAVCAAVTARLIQAGYRAIHLFTESWRLPALKTYLKLGYVPFLYQKGMAARWQAICAQLGWPSDQQTWRRQ